MLTFNTSNQDNPGWGSLVLAGSAAAELARSMWKRHGPLSPREAFRGKSLIIRCIFLGFRQRRVRSRLRPPPFSSGNISNL